MANACKVDQKNTLFFPGWCLRTARHGGNLNTDKAESVWLCF